MRTGLAWVCSTMVVTPLVPLPLVPVGKVLPIGGPGVHQVDMCVDHPREHEQAGSVDHGPRRLEIAHGNDATPGHSQVGGEPPTRRDDRPAFDG